MEIAPGTFIVGDDTTSTTPVRVKLAGLYDTKVFQNEEQPDWEQKNIHHWIIVFERGNVLRRVETEGIDDLIKLFIRYTYDPCNDVEGIERVLPKTVMGPYGKQFPNEKVFTYKGKMFCAYNRYCFAYDHYGREFFRREHCYTSSDTDSDEVDSDDCEEYSSYWDSDSDVLYDGSDYEDYYKKHFNIDKEEDNSMITNDKIQLNGPKSNHRTDDYVYAFQIYDQKTEIVDAFGLYR